MTSMLQLPRLLAGGLVVLGLLLAVTPVQAQRMEPTVVAVVDLQHLLRDSRAGQSIEVQMEQLRDGFANRVAVQESALRQEEKDLQDQAALLAPEVLAERRRQFEEKVVTLQRDVRAQQQALEQTYAGGVGQIRQAIVEILSALVDERGIDLVVPQTAVLVGTRSLDITGEVLSRLDQQLPSVTLSAPGGN